MHQLDHLKNLLSDLDTLEKFSLTKKQQQLIDFIILDHKKLTDLQKKIEEENKEQLENQEEQESQSPGRSPVRKNKVIKDHKENTESHSLFSLMKKKTTKKQIKRLDI